MSGEQISDPFDDDLHHSSSTPTRTHIDDLSDEALASALNTVDLGVGAEGKGVSHDHAPVGRVPGPDMFPDLDEKKAASAAASVFGMVKKGQRFFVTVSDPEKKGDGVYAYISYKVNTKIDEGHGQVRQSSVVRRYSDFTWLRNQLLERQDGWLIPPLPEKAIMGRFSPMFVDSRRRGLELFLNRLAQHKELCKDEDVELFLFGGQKFQDAKAGKIAAAEANAAAAKNKKGFLDYISELSQTVSNTWGAGKEREKSKDDIACDQIQAYAESLESTVGSVFKNIQVLTKKTKAIANAWFDFGFSCTLLGQYETEQDEQQLGNAFAKLGNCADRISVLVNQLVDSEIVNFQEPFEDFLRIVESVKSMLKDRSAALLTYQTSLSTLEGKQAALTRYQSKQGKEEKAASVEKEVVEAQRRVDDDMKRLQEVTERVFSETTRFRNEKRFNFKQVMVHFVTMQIEASKKIQASWEGILADMESLPFHEDE